MGSFSETMHPSVCIEAIEKLGKKRFVRKLKFKNNLTFFNIIYKLTISN